jgi:hypothetical protein
MATWISAILPDDTKVPGSLVNVAARLLRGRGDLSSLLKEAGPSQSAPPRQEAKQPRWFNPSAGEEARNWLNAAQAEADLAGTGAPSDPVGPVTPADLKGAACCGIHGFALRRVTCHCQEENTPGLNRIKTLCNKRSCPRCGAEDFEESGWGDQHSYNVAAAAAFVLLQRYNSSALNEVQQCVRSMELTGCAHFLWLIATVFAGGYDKGISHFGVVAGPCDEVPDVCRDSRLRDYYVQKR